MTAFDDAVRSKIGAPADAVVYAEVRGGGEVMISDVSWGEEDVVITVEAWETRDGVRTDRIYHKKFETFDGVWNEFAPRVLA